MRAVLSEIAVEEVVASYKDFFFGRQIVAQPFGNHVHETESGHVLELDDKNILITQNGEELIQKTTDRRNEKIIKIFSKTDPKNMSGFINIIESL